MLEASGHIPSTAKEQRALDASTPFPLVLSTFQVGLPTSVNPIKVILQTPTEQPRLRAAFLETPFQVILDSVNFIINTNHHWACCGCQGDRQSESPYQAGYLGRRLRSPSQAGS